MAAALKTYHFHARPCATCGHDTRHSDIAGCTQDLEFAKWCDCKAYVDPVQAEKPYAGTSGHSGSDTSQARAERRDSTGATGKTQAAVLADAQAKGPHGVTVAEVRALHPDQHHGTLSGALSVLHKTGHLVRLTEVRDRCQVYVLPEYVAGREVAPHGRKRSGLNDDERDALASLRHGLVQAHGEDHVVDAEDLEAVLDALGRYA